MRAFSLGLGFLLVLGAGVAEAELPPRTYMVQLLSKPPGVPVCRPPNRILGVTGEQPLPVDFGPDEKQVELDLAAEGYKPVQLWLSRQEAQEGHSNQKLVRLEPDSLSTWLACYGGWVAGWGLALVLPVAALAGLWLRRERAVRHRLGREALLSQLQAQAPNGDELAMTILGGYRLIEPLGQGAFATVYRAVPEASLDAAQAVAVKVWKREGAQEKDLEEARRRLSREVALFRDLQHPGIAQMYTVGEQEGLLYAVYELVPGQTLESRLSPHGMSVQEAWALLEPVLEAVGYAHSRKSPVVHRDLKPSNLMLTPEGKVKVLDFGLARSEASAKLTDSGTLLGTPAYVAPEQVTGAYGPAADQYAVGVMAYELLSGQLPFVGSDPLAVVLARLQSDPVPLRQLRDVPEPVERVVMRMLAREPQQRYPSIQGAGAAMRAAIQAVESPC